MHILVVEDSRALAAILSARLASFGHEVTLAENGKIGVEKFTQSAYDLVLMDIEMPIMNGFEATNRIRAYEATQQWAWTPILFLTASDTLENLVTAIEAGGDDFLAKSVPEDALRAKMKAMGRIAALRRQLSIANQQLDELASRDGLTGLTNRRAMDLKLDMAWEEATMHGQSFGVLMLDVDNFKKYNDHYGHQMGDDCLRSVAAAIESAMTAARAEGCVGASAFAARYGGEEFAVVIPDIKAHVCERVATLILDALRARTIAHEKNANYGIVTASIGGACLEKAEGRIADMFRTADIRLYRAKENGRNQAVLAD